MNDDLRRAVEALEAGAVEARELSLRSVGQVRDRLRRTVEEVLEHLEADEEASQNSDDIFGGLERKSRDIAEELRRVDELMKRRTGRE